MWSAKSKTRTTGIRDEILQALCVLLGLMALCLWPTVKVFAQIEAEEPHADDATILAELGNDDYFVRQEAIHRLLCDNELAQDDLNRLYSKSETPEQQHRLLLVARHHMIRRMIHEQFGDEIGPGSMGLSHFVVRVTGPDGKTERAGVMVVMTLPGFPAYALLEPGDVIVEFAGAMIPDRITQAQFQQMIRTYQAGDQIPLVVMRNGKPVKMLFVLSQGQALGRVYDNSGITLKDPYRTQWNALRVSMESLISMKNDN